MMQMVALQSSQYSPDSGPQMQRLPIMTYGITCMHTFLLFPINSQGCAAPLLAFSNEKKGCWEICAETYAAVVAEALIRLRNPVFDPPSKLARVAHPHNTSSSTAEIQVRVPENVLL